MRILLLNANRVGVGTYHRALNFGRELARRGHKITMMTVSNTRKFTRHSHLDRDGLQIIECPNWGDQALPWGASGFLDIVWRLRNVWNGGYDVVYAFEYQPNISVPALLSRKFRKFTLISDWCDWHAGASYHFGGYRLAHAIDRYFEEFIRHRADFVTTINLALYERAISIGVPPERVAVIGEGVDPNYIKPLDLHVARSSLGLPQQVPIVATIRDADDGAELLCRAVAALASRNVHLLVVGSRPEPIRRYAESLGIEARTILPGRVSDEALPNYLGAANVLALPLENNLINRGRWPHKLGDMLASERPVVVTRAGEFPELLEQRRCAVIVEYHADAFMRVFAEIIDSPDAYADVAARGRALIETELNWDVIGADLERMLAKATST